MKAKQRKPRADGRVNKLVCVDDGYWRSLKAHAAANGLHIGMALEMAIVALVGAK